MLKGAGAGLPLQTFVDLRICTARKARPGCGETQDIRRSHWGKMMKAHIVGVLAMALLMAAPVAEAQQAEGAGASTEELTTNLTGTWRLVAVETLRPNGETITEWMGQQPSGLIIYHPNGLMSVQIMRDPRPVFKSGTRLEATPEELKSAYLGYYAYWGRYAINATDRMIVHSVEGSLWPEEVGITYKRYFMFDEARLVLTTAPYKRAGEERRNRLTWERVE